MIEFNKVTWYSKTFAILVGLFVLLMVFYLGRYYQETQDIKTQLRTETLERQQQLVQAIVEASKPKYEIVDIAEEEFQGTRDIEGQPLLNSMLPDCPFSEDKSRFRCGEEERLADSRTVTRVNDRCLEVIFGQEGEVTQICDQYAPDGYPMLIYTYVKTIPEVGHVFQTVFSEGSGYMLLHPVTGEQMQLFGEPLFSPDREWFLAVGLDITESEYNQNGFQIWKRVHGVYELESVASMPRGVGIFNPVWIHNHEIHFAKWATYYRNEDLEKLGRWAEPEHLGFAKIILFD